MRRQKIVVLSPYRQNGEAVTNSSETSALHFVTEALTQRLAEDGLDIRVIAPSTSATAGPRWSDGLVEIEHIARFRGPRGILDLLNHIPRDRRVIHLEHELYAYGGMFGAILLPIAMWLLRLRGHRILTTLHGVIPLDSIDSGMLASYRVPGIPIIVRAAWRLLIRAIAYASDTVHVHEKRFRDILIEQYDIRRRIAVIPLGVDNRYRAIDRTNARGDLGIRHDAQVVCFFGFLYKRKGIVELLRGVRALLEANPNIVVLVAGDLPVRAGDATEIRDLLASLADCDRLRTFGFISDDAVGPLLSASDVLILPYTFSMSASGPMTVGAAHGLPLLLSDRFAESFPEFQDFFEPTSLGITRAIESFFDDPIQRERATAFSRSLLAERSWAAVAALMIDEYRLLETPNIPR